MYRLALAGLVLGTSLACAAGGEEATCVEGQRTCHENDLYTCIEGTLQLLEDCEDQFGCTTHAAGFEGQAMCAWGGG
jgi:hypothetical protein